MYDVEIKKINGEYIAYHGTDEGLHVTIEMESLKDEEKSVLEGRPIYIDKPFITIRIPGDKTTVVKRPLREEDKYRFAIHWQRFLSQDYVASEGTPIEQWAIITKSQAMELKALNIHTVESLSEVSDANLKWPQARSLRDQAIKWLESANDGKIVAQWEHREKELVNEIETLKSEIAIMKNYLHKSNSHNDQPKKRGRKPLDVEKSA